MADNGARSGDGKDGGRPHYTGHRQRLRQRVLDAGGQALQDYEILEVLLFAAHPRGDVKPLAKRLLQRFGSLAAVLAADPGDLAGVKGMGDAAAATLKVTQEAAERAGRERAQQRTVLSDWEKVLRYCRVAMAEDKVEQVRVLFLNRKNQLIADEQLARGTVDHTPASPREIIKRALALEASAIILVHNHPSGDPTPSKADVEMTREIADAGKKLSVNVHDHVIITRTGHASFKRKGLL
ncbi:DNA repair protein RadC [Limimonas halophila]|uniref:DNA repair protein RadC n=1 Tax=Limimonas halophila TaxID=1082479 RepID=A0A1G7RBI1_9PROT|nr:DNA repair protein RadC [Limimonas halophila]SDG07519.1 DNA repair protein RadC [Limimonas halophila]